MHLHIQEIEGTDKVIIDANDLALLALMAADSFRVKAGICDTAKEVKYNNDTAEQLTQIYINLSD